MRYAVRTLVKNPGFTTVAILAIALGVGPNTAVFSIIHAVLLEPLPIGNAERVVIIWETNQAHSNEQIGVSPQDLLDWRRESRSFTGLVPANGSPEYGFNLTGGSEPERVLGAKVGVNLTEVMQVRPAAGRGFLPEEGRPGGPPAVMLSYQLWQRRFGADPSMIGRSIGLDGVSYRIAGVLPAELRSIGSVDVWIANNDDMEHTPRDARRYGVFARLRDGVTLAQAQADMDGLQQRLAQRYPETNTHIGAVLLPVTSILNSARPAFLMLAAAVGLLLLIACANVAGLLLARGSARQKENAVRAALGASAARLVRQLLGESLILSIAGGAAGLVLAAVSLSLLRNALPDIIPRLKGMRVDWSVLAFTLAASILTGLLFGIAPALRLAHTRVNEMLNDGGGKGTAYGGRQRGRSLLLLGEVALAVVLLAAAGLLIRSFAHLASVRPGFQPANLLTMKLSLPDTKYGEVARRAAFTRNVLRRVSGIPGVRAASSISVLPMRSYFLSLPANVAAYHIDGEPELPAAERPSADFRVVSRDFLAAMGISLLRGRDFNGHDDLDSKRVALVNEALVRRAGKDVLGRKIQIMSGAPREIVGVIPDVRLYNLDGGVRPGVFVLNDQSPSFVVTLLVRTGSDPAAAAGAVRRAVQAEDGQQPVSDIQTMEQVVADSLLLRRLSMSMLASFASLALLLAGVGIYGLTAYSVSRRTREIGLRMALGAGRGDILSLVVGRGLLVGIAGVALGVPAALGVARLMRGMLYGITPADPLVFATVPAILLLIAALACYVPARRAMRVDPVVALKYE